MVSIKVISLQFDQWKRDLKYLSSKALIAIFQQIMTLKRVVLTNFKHGYALCVVKYHAAITVLFVPCDPITLKDSIGYL